MAVGALLVAAIEAVVLLLVRGGSEGLSFVGGRNGGEALLGGPSSAFTADVSCFVAATEEDS